MKRNVVVKRCTKQADRSAIPAPPAAGPVGEALANRLETALWLYDFDAGKIAWANCAALKLWDADSVAALVARDMRAEMSTSVRKRLAQHRDDFALFPDREIREFWTLYPEGAPFRVRAILRRAQLADGRLGMLVEAHAEDLREPATIRSADALLHTQIITALFDHEGRELYANPAFRAAFGPGRHDFGVAFASAADVATFLDGVANHGEHRATVAVATVTGERWHDIHAVRCRDAVTGDGAFLISAMDVTAAREHEQQLQAARDAALAADRAKSLFLATMSHEMRTPLNGVLGMASLLAHCPLDAQQKKMLAVIAESGEHMLELVEDMLDIVAIDARSIQLRKQPFDPELLLQAAIEAARATADAKGLRLVADARACRGRAFLHDASRIRQVLRQMVTNAVKFTESGAVVLRAQASAAGDLRFEVADTGPGVAPDERARIFERFYQSDGTATRRHGGAGLGLAICRELVALWGGEIGVDSPAGKGATFWFTVPGAAAPAQDASAGAASAGA